MQNEQIASVDATTTPPVKVLLISVGGTAAPILFSIRQHQPDKIVFFASVGTRSKINSDILPAILREFSRLPDHEFIITPDEQDIGASAFELLHRMPETLRKLGIKDLMWPNFVDYTGGTKTMSAAVVWASSRYPCHFSYIGSIRPEDRTKAGVGVVLDGREQWFLRENPWDKVAFFEVRSALKLFNRGQYGNAAALVKSLVERVDDTHLRRVFEVIAETFHGYYEWDIFNHRGACAVLGKVQQPLADLSHDKVVVISGLEEFVEQTAALFEILCGIKNDRLSWNKIIDLLANALRRAELEQKYDDAAARCYSALEKAARHALLYDCDINTSHAEPEKIPEELRAEYIQRYRFLYTDGHGNVSERLRFGLLSAYRLLRAMPERDKKGLGRRFHERETEILKHLEARNSSILAHGENPISREEFYDLFNDALFVLGCSEHELTRFPIFKDEL